MRFASALSTATGLEAACREAAAAARARLGGAPADLALLFLSPGYSELERAPHWLAEVCDPRCLVGCTGGGILGGGSEVEGKLALSLLLASLPGVGLHPVLVTDADLPDGDDPPSKWTSLLGVPPTAAAGFLVLPEPFSSSAERLLLGLDFAYPDAPKLGGIVSGSRRQGGHALFLDRAVHRGGALVLGFSGDVAVDTVVAQGCKPFGSSGRITSAQRNHLVAVDGMPALEFVQRQLARLEGREREIARSGQVFLGIAMHPFADAEPAHGDFLIRNLLGFDEQHGVVAIGELLQVGRRVRMHLRDSVASHDDLEQLLRRSAARSSGGAPPAGAVMFSCLGRGQGLYGEPDHDSRVFREILGDVPLAGFFCNGEIGPVQGATHLHGYTSSFGLFRPAARAR